MLKTACAAHNEVKLIVKQNTSNKMSLLARKQLTKTSVTEIIKKN